MTAGTYRVGSSGRTDVFFLSIVVDALVVDSAWVGAVKDSERANEIPMFLCVG